MPDWAIYIFIVFLLVSYGLLARACYTQGRKARWFGEKLPGLIGFALAITVATLAIDLVRHGLDYSLENPFLLVARFTLVLALQIIPYGIGTLRGRKQRSSGIIGMD